MSITRWQVLGTVALASSLVGCKGSLPTDADAFDADPLQTWEFTLLHNEPSLSNVAKADCNRTACDAASWEILDKEIFGCAFYLDFAVQFSGKNVRFHTAKNGDDTTCDVSALINGTGNADDAYPNAIEATGSVTITTMSRFLEPTAFTKSWSGRRIN